MALRATITGNNAIPHGGSTTLTASVFVIETGLSHTLRQGTVFSWEIQADPLGNINGSFTPPTTVPTVEYIADNIEGNELTLVTIRCNITEPPDPLSPSAPSVSISAAITIRVSSNQPPQVILSPLTAQNLIAGQSQAFGALVVDPENDAIVRTTWSEVASQGRFSIPNSDSLVYSNSFITPTGVGGTFVVQLEAEDSEGNVGTGSATVSTTVPTSPTNTPPNIIVRNIPSQLVAGGPAVDLEIETTDADLDTIQWRVLSGGGTLTPQGAVETDAGTHIARFTPPHAIGTVQISFTARDDAGNVGSIQAQIQIIEAAFTMSIGYDANLERGENTTLTSVIRRTIDNAVVPSSNFTYTWTFEPNRGSLAVLTDRATARYTATDPGSTAFSVLVTCSATSDAGNAESRARIFISGDSDITLQNFTRTFIRPIRDKITVGFFNRLVDNTIFNKLSGINNKPRASYGVTRTTAIRRYDTTNGHRYKVTKTQVLLSQRQNGVSEFSDTNYVVILQHSRETSVGPETERSFPTYSVYGKTTSSFWIAYNEGIGNDAFDDEDDDAIQVSIAWYARGT